MVGGGGALIIIVFFWLIPGMISWGLESIHPELPKRLAIGYMAVIFAPFFILYGVGWLIWKGFKK
jgi:hypothetical protein